MTKTAPHAFGVDDIALTLVSVPNPVPSAGHFNRALLGTFSRAPKGSQETACTSRWIDEVSAVIGRQNGHDAIHKRGRCEVCSFLALERPAAQYLKRRSHCLAIVPQQPPIL
jgi:hypothetical protein